jgi:hypothetical protein
MKKCIDKILKNQIINNISASELEKVNVKGELKLFPKFLINNDGSLSNIKVKANTNEFSNEINRVVALLPKPIIPPMRNENPTGLFYRGVVNLFPNLSRENDLALHFKKYLSDKELQNIPFSKKQEEIRLIFSIDKKGKAVEIKTLNFYANKSSYDKLVSIFKKFPIEKLNINSKDILERYIYIVIIKSNNKTIVECSNTAWVEKEPILKGCEKSKNPTELKECTNEKMATHISRKFNNSLLDKIKRKGKIRMLCSYKVDTDGTIVDVKVKAPYLFLAKEVEKNIKEFPKVTAPAYQNGKAVKVGYTFPFTVFNE